MAALLSERNITLLLALVALLSAPLVYRAVRRSGPLRAAMDGFVLLAVGGLLVVHLVPESVEAGGLWAVGGLMVGLGLPVFLEVGGGLLARRVHLTTLLLALGGLAVHAALDGVALSMVGLSGSTTALGVAVVLHRLPTGLLVWSRAEPTWGAVRAFTLLNVLVIATVIGFVLGATGQQVLSSEGVAVFQALVAGSLAHVLVHRPEHDPDAPDARHRLGELLGALLGIGTLLLVGGGEHGDHHFVERFEALALRVAPPLLIGLMAAALVGVALAPRLAAGAPRGGHLRGALRGTLFGLAMPVCSCASDRVYGGVKRHGARPGMALAFFVATPTLAVEAIVLSAWLLGGWVTLLWVAGAGLIAVAAGWWLGPRAPNAVVDEHATVAHPQPVPRRGGRLRQLLRIALVELLDGVGPWVIVGVAVAAAVEPGLAAGLLERLPAGVDLVLFAFLGIPGSIGAAGAVVFAVAITVAGASPGAGVAFVLAGPTANLSGLRQLAALHGWSLARRFAALVITAAVVVGALVNGLGAAVPEAFEVPVAPWLSWGALAIVGLALLGSVARRGPSAFVRTVLSLGEHEHHDHDEHDHGGLEEPDHHHARLGLSFDGHDD